MSSDGGHWQDGHMAPSNRQAFGIDFGGTGIKGAPVDLEVGDFAEERVRITTPQPATPEAKPSPGYETGEVELPPNRTPGKNSLAGSPDRR